MRGAVGTEASSPMLIKTVMGEVRRNLSTHRKGFDKDNVDKRED